MKKILFVVSSLIIVTVTLSLLLNDDPNKSKYATSSQQGTKVDIGSSRDLFEYFLSTSGERDVGDIKAQFEKFILEGGYPLPGQEALFDKYIAYRQSLSLLTIEDQNQMSLTYLEDLFERLKALQAEHFTEQEIAMLFGGENSVRDLFLKQRRWAEDGLSEEIRQQLLQDELSQLPPYLVKAYKNADVLNELSAASEKTGQEKFLAREALVGYDAAVRLEKLDQEEAAFEKKLASYLAKRDAMIADGSGDTEQAISELRQQSFLPVELRRIEALERIHDQRGEK
ncbi:lipase secretion chaperone [Veronia pacifica]|uniref:Lipase chaperone n=1 Tax=Veronia pacifica TaxID=1080227 RepID=A0A1C3EII8_9GAMM|nr:lipase secretion chaperone [Veronia pacifica]ODA33038.1 hypothetical protein A8L45_12165 [Veronia pacifica]